MRGLLIAVAGVLVLTFGLAYAVKHLFQIEPGRREAAIDGTRPGCGPSADSRPSPPGTGECNDQRR